MTIDRHVWSAEIPVEPFQYDGAVVWGGTGYESGDGTDESVIGGPYADTRIVTSPPDPVRTGRHAGALFHPAAVGGPTGAGTMDAGRSGLPLVNGRGYRLYAWVYGLGYSLDVAGWASGGVPIGPAVNTPPNVWTRVVYDFVATSTSISVGLAFTMNAMPFTVNLVVVDDIVLVERPWAYSLPLDIISGGVTIDAAWSPRIQATLTCATPAPEVLQQIDPRGPTRLRIRASRQFGTGFPVSALDGATFDLTAAYGGSVAAITAGLGTGFNGDPRQSQVATFDLALRSRSVSSTGATMTLTAASDEALLQDAARVDDTTGYPSGTGLVDAAAYALARIGATLSTDVDDVPYYTTDSLAWTPGVSAWNYVTPLTDAGDRQLYCDEQRSWHLVDPARATGGGLRVTPTRVDMDDTITRDGDWYDAVVVEYRWTDGGGIDRTAYDVAGPADAQRVLMVTVERPKARDGMAAAMLRSASSRARNVQVEAVADYTARPGQSLTVDLEDGTTQTATVRAVTFSAAPPFHMTVTTRDLTEVTPGTYSAIPAGVTYGDIPAGQDWDEYMDTLEA